MPEAPPIARPRRAMADFAEETVRTALATVLAPGAVMRLGHPFGTGPGAAMRAFAPMTQDGLADHAPGRAAVDLVTGMVTHMTRHPSQGGPEVMEMPRFWHSRFTWYGPAGIGAARGISGFRRWHQMDFLTAFPGRGLHGTGTSHHFFGAGDCAAVAGWPTMRMTLTGGNWLGPPATGGTITLRSLDFWRLEAGLIRENGVLVDLLDAHRQIGTEPLDRMRQMNRARQGFDPETGKALS